MNTDIATIHNNNVTAKALLWQLITMIGRTLTENNNKLIITNISIATNIYTTNDNGNNTNNLIIIIIVVITTTTMVIVSSVFV